MRLSNLHAQIDQENIKKLIKNIPNIYNKTFRVNME